MVVGRPFACLTLAAALALTACAREKKKPFPTPPPPPTVSAPAAEEAASTRKPVKGTEPLVLWKAKSESATVHVLASINVASRSFFPLDARIEDVLASADTVVVESPLGEASKKAAERKLLGIATYLPPKTLNDSLQPETRALLDAHLRRLGTEGDAYDDMHPWFVATVVSLTELNRRDFQADLGIDQYVFEKAKKAKKKIETLESLQDQIDFYQTLPDETQDLFLRDALETIHHLDDRAKSVISAWQRGDAKALDWLLMRNLRRTEYEPVLRTVYLDRNEKMAAKIEGYLQNEGSTLVVASAAHVLGAGGIGDLLTQKEIELEKL